jgi:hypothetical protein
MPNRWLPTSPLPKWIEGPAQRRPFALSELRAVRLVADGPPIPAAGAAPMLSRANEDEEP